MTVQRPEGDAPNHGVRKTVLQVLPSLESGGVERVVADLNHGLQRYGWRVIVASNGGRLVPQIRTHGGTHLHLPLHSKNPFVIWRNARRLKRLIQGANVDIVHVHSRAPAWSVQRAAKRARIPWVSTFHAQFGHQNALKRYYNSVLLRSDAVTTVSQHTAQHIEKVYRFPQNKITLTPPGTDLERFDRDAVSHTRMESVIKTLGIPYTKPIWLLPARLSPGKQHAMMLDAAAKLMDLDFILLFVGGMPTETENTYANALREQARQLGLAERLYIRPTCDDMPALYKLAQVVVSAIRAEAFGLTTCEAAAMGTPVVAARHGATPEILPHNAPGLFTPGDVEAFAHCLRHAHTMQRDDPRLMKTTDRIHAYFGRQHCAETLHNLYMRLLPSRR